MKIHLALCNSDRWENNRAFYFQPLSLAGPLAQRATGCSTHAGTPATGDDVTVLAPVTRTVLAQPPVIKERVRTAHRIPVPVSACWEVGLFYPSPELGAWGGMAVASPQCPGASHTAMPCVSALPRACPQAGYLHFPQALPSKPRSGRSRQPSPWSHRHKCMRRCQHSLFWGER